MMTSTRVVKTSVTTTPTQMIKLHYFMLPLGSNHLLKCFFLEKVWGNKEIVVFRKESLWLWLWEGRVSYGPSRRWLFLSCFQARLEFGMLDYVERLKGFMIGWNSWNISPFLFNSLHQTQAHTPFHSQDLFS